MTDRLFSVGSLLDLCARALAQQQQEPDLPMRGWSVTLPLPARNWKPNRAMGTLLGYVALEDEFRSPSHQGYYFE